MQRCIRALMSGIRFAAMITRVLILENGAEDTAEPVLQDSTAAPSSTRAFSIDLGQNLALPPVLPRFS